MPICFPAKLCVSQVLVVNGEHRVSFREVEALRVGGEWVGGGAREFAAG